VFLDGGAALRNFCASLPSGAKTLRGMRFKRAGLTVDSYWHGLCVSLELMNEPLVSKDALLPASLEKTVWGAVISVVCFTVILAVVLLWR
jgi:hypothetical protein